MAREPFVRADGLPVTSLARTAFDCMRTLSLREAVAVADSALRHGTLTYEGLVSYVAEKGGRYRGARQAALAARLANPLSESGGESVVRVAIYELGFAAPDLQTTVADPLDPTRTYRADFHWRLPDSSDLFGELDGREKYVNPQMNDGSTTRALLAERRRESRMTAGQGRIMRFSPDEVADTAFFSALLETFGVPRDHEPLIEVPAAPDVELVPADAYRL